MPHAKAAPLNLCCLFKGVTIDHLSLHYRKYRSHIAQFARDFFGGRIIQFWIVSKGIGVLL